MTRFAGKVALITGASSGIGLAAAMRFAHEGARVAIVYLHPRGPELTDQLAEAGAPEAIAHAADVADEHQMERVVNDTLQRFGRLDVIINNAGMMTFKPIVELSSAEWRRVLDVDLMGAVHLTRLGLLHLPAGGAIVNVSSVHAERTTPLVAPYAAAKAALLALTRSTAIEGAAKGIRANAVIPGAIDTPMLWNNPNLKSGAEKIEASDVGKPEDVAAAIAFLASEDARFITGSALRVDGGRLARL